MDRFGKRNVITWILLIAAIASCIYGIARGEASMVFVTASNICRECIGIG